MRTLCGSHRRESPLGVDTNAHAAAAAAMGPVVGQAFYVSACATDNPHTRQGCRPQFLHPWSHRRHLSRCGAGCTNRMDRQGIHMHHGGDLGHLTGGQHYGQQDRRDIHARTGRQFQQTWTHPGGIRHLDLVAATPPPPPQNTADGVVACSRQRRESNAKQAPDKEAHILTGDVSRTRKAEESMTPPTARCIRGVGKSTTDIMSGVPRSTTGPIQSSS